MQIKVNLTINTEDHSLTEALREELCRVLDDHFGIHTVSCEVTEVDTRVQVVQRELACPDCGMIHKPLQTICYKDLTPKRVRVQFKGNQVYAVIQGDSLVAVQLPGDLLDITDRLTPGERQVIAHRAMSKKAS